MQLTKKIGIDLGTTTARVWVQGKGVVLNEPTVVVLSLDTRKVLAVGKQARDMLGRAPSNILASRPLRNGVIADYSVTEAMLRSFLLYAQGRSRFFKPEVMVAVPASSTQVERRAVMDATMSAGAGSVYLIDNALAAIVGAGLPIAEATGNMVLDVGGGVSEAAVVSLGGVIAHRGVRIGGSAFDDAIVKHIRKEFGVVIGDQTAEHLKKVIGTAMRPEGPEQRKKLEVKGRDAAHGLPKEIVVTSADVFEAIQKPLSQIVEITRRVLEEIPPELASDIIDKGVVLTGGSSTLDSFDTFITSKIGVPATVAEHSEFCVIQGIGRVFSDLDVYRHAIQTR